MTTQTIAPYNGAVLTLGGAASVLTAAFVLYMLMTHGHAAFNSSSDGVMWGLPVATYVFLVLSSTGLTMLASLAMVFGLRDFYPLAKRCVWLAVATLIGGFAALAFELGHPFRMLWALPLSFQIISPMNWMGVLYLLYLVFLLWKFSRLRAGDWDSPASYKLGVASFVSVVIAHGTLALVFGMMAMRPFWYNGLAPVHFLLAAFGSGVALAILVSYLAHGFRMESMPPPLRSLMSGAMPKLFAAILAALLVAAVSRTVTGTWTNVEGAEVFEWTTRSPWFHLALWGGLVLPLALMLAPSTRGQGNVQLLAAALALLGIAIDRYQYVVGGQIVPLFKGQWVPDFIPYVPSLTEWMLALLGLALAAAIYAFGEKRYDLSAVPPQRS